MKILIVFFCIFAYKIASNLIAGLRTSYCMKVYTDWIQEKASDFPRYAMSTIKLLKRAGIADTKIPVSRLLETNQIMNATASIFDNITVRDVEIIPRIIDKFEMAIGVYKSRIIETFNPIYWIDLIVFAPKNILEYLGFDLDNHSAKVCNILLTVIWWGVCVVFTAFHEQIKVFIINLLEVSP